jgi:hypothetical protein
MIRREVGNEFFLITQDDHAKLAGELARHFGNDRFARPAPWQDVIDGVSLHDAGWPIHDDAPTLNSSGLPLDVFESTRPLAFRIWHTSADRAISAGAYADLLVSLHNLSLSVIATTQPAGNHEKFDMSKMTEQFELNKFQHREIERQEKLRKELGMSTDRPLKFGLAFAGTDAAEDQLLFNFRLLQAMDMCSLSLCCTAPPSPRTNDVMTRVGGNAIQLSLKRERNNLLVNPWPFEMEKIVVEIPFKRVRAERFASEEAFRAKYSAAPRELIETKVVPVSSR